MKRDMDLIRKLLERVEELPPNESLEAHELELPGETSEAIIYHAVLLHEAGLVHGEVDDSFRGTIGARLDRLTWEGHEFVDAARSDTIWEKAKGLLGERGISASIDVLKPLLVDLARQALMGG